MRSAGNVGILRVDPIVSLLAASGGLARALGGRELVPEGIVESRNVVRLAAGDELAINDHLLVGPIGAGVAQVVLQRGPARELEAFRDTGVDERPRPVADGGDG